MQECRHVEITLINSQRDEFTQLFTLRTALFWRILCVYINTNIYCTAHSTYTLYKTHKNCCEPYWAKKSSQLNQSTTQVYY